jgi:hypothetical protein
MTRSKMVYEWSHHRFSVDPATVAKTILKVERSEGSCPPGRLVDVARDEQSPLHPLFTWEDNMAADRWRTHEARQVIGSLVEVVMVGDMKTARPAFVSVGHTEETAESGSGYRSVSVVMSDGDFAQEALADALSRLNALRRRYAALSELAPVWAALDEIAGEEKVQTAA